MVSIDSSVPSPLNLVSITRFLFFVNKTAVFVLHHLVPVAFLDCLAPVSYMFFIKVIFARMLINLTFFLCKDDG